MKLLFVCTAGMLRSPTGARVFRERGFATDFGGVGFDPINGQPWDEALTQQKVDWADIIFVMEYRHRNLLRKRFKVSFGKIKVLHIPDDYERDDPVLVALLKARVTPYVARAA